LRAGERGYSGAKIAGSVALCLLGVWFGHIVAAALSQLKGAKPWNCRATRSCCGSSLGRPTVTGTARSMRRSCSRRGRRTSRAPPCCGADGYGRSSRLHTAKILRLSEDLPLLIEIVDTEEKVNAFLPVLDSTMTSGLVTLERVQVLRYGGDPAASS
jgi:hypothetical protein